MHAITIREPGGPEVLEWTEQPDPTPGPDEVLIDVAASALNRADLMQREGKYPPPPGVTEVPGLECSGTIAAVGDNVTGWQVGDRVCALLAGGGYATKAVAPVGQMLPAPNGVDLIDAAGLPEVACTVWSMVVMNGRLGAGETFLVHGGAGGIGTHAIQVARALGATVAATAGSGEKLARCAELGAQITINYRDEDFVQRMKEAGGADVILDNMGAAYLGRNVDALNRLGRLVIIGMQGGIKGELNLGALLGKNCAVIAGALRSRPRPEKADIVAQVREHVWPLVESGEVKPVIHEIVPADRASDAHRALAGPDVVGKVVLRMP
ncbi:NAD(P)H-quinone oxidoreductase [Labedaea rhizosphaerae]|uniref:Putative PIG3 family NAD(P)H quinone oxidoreductase n=1 Tax=Labedaea rhizosphaerae TaxID=598644 RepID=A0A4R6SNJ0_LABRH|nr:NAD(P)H-quinone oxidoreductase [Labedaea rhizosphaerae]TDQ04962.1 putative PIG3 family NAD(P)H quinone oxidoreductase [Labedaea rhizosphaerae]